MKRDPVELLLIGLLALATAVSVGVCLWSIF